MNDTTRPPERADLRQQYAKFVAGGNPDDASRYARGLQDFDALCAIPEVAAIAIDWSGPRLLVGLACIDVESTWGLKEIGEIIIKIGQKPPSFRFENVTRTTQTGCHHPHVNSSGDICMRDGKEETHVAIVEGRISEAVQILCRALWMRDGEVISGSRFSGADLEYWPLKSEVAK